MQKLLYVLLVRELCTIFLGLLLDEHRLREEGYFEPRPILDKWREHLSGAQDWRAYLWDILMFQAWLEAQPIGGKVAA